MMDAYVFILLLHFIALTKEGILYPRETISREVKSLDGIWNFRMSPLTDQRAGFREKWFRQPLSFTGLVIDMPVPSSYNDITQSRELRDFVGWVWYDRKIFIHSSWSSTRKKIFIRFGSVAHYAKVWFNGILVCKHSGGYLPFACEITPYVFFKEESIVTIAVNNTLSPITIPPGRIIYPVGPEYPPGYFEQQFDFDFFNYAGIHRFVYIYTTPVVYIDDIDIATSINGSQGIVDCNVTVSGKKPFASKTLIEVYDSFGKLVTAEKGNSARLIIENCRYWWPLFMNDTPGYLYKLQITVTSNYSLDVYYLMIGVRTVSWNNTSLLVNGKPFYLRGFGRHEDYQIRGKGADNVMIVKDHNLLNWIGANSYRTSHYPYAEEILDMADKMGFAIIAEAPAVALRELLEHARNISAARPFIAALSYPCEKDRLGQFLDIIGVNKYFGWYDSAGRLELVRNKILVEVRKWRNKYKKPVMITEYGAGTVAGFHADPSFTWTEEYQNEILVQSFEAFDILKKEGYFIGEHIWNFADFLTPQEYFRPMECKKVVFNRDRQPKSAAYTVKNRYHELAVTANNSVHRCSMY